MLQSTADDAEKKMLQLPCGAGNHVMLKAEVVGRLHCIDAVLTLRWRSLTLT
jgi:hypothetical protein